MLKIFLYDILVIFVGHIIHQSQYFFSYYKDSDISIDIYYTLMQSNIYLFDYIWDIIISDQGDSTCVVGDTSQNVFSDSNAHTLNVETVIVIQDHLSTHTEIPWRYCRNKYKMDKIDNMDYG